jgi:hypothetical protein
MKKSIFFNAFDTHHKLYCLWKMLGRSSKIKFPMLPKCKIYLKNLLWVQILQILNFKIQIIQQHQMLLFCQKSIYLCFYPCLHQFKLIKDHYIDIFFECFIPIQFHQYFCYCLKMKLLMYGEDTYQKDTTVSVYWVCSWVSCQCQLFYKKTSFCMLRLTNVIRWVKKFFYSQFLKYLYQSVELYLFTFWFHFKKKHTYIYILVKSNIVGRYLTSQYWTWSSWYLLSLFKVVWWYNTYIYIYIYIYNCDGKRLK